MPIVFLFGAERLCFRSAYGFEAMLVSADLCADRCSRLFFPYADRCLPFFVFARAGVPESFGFDGAEDYAVDLDGDGVKELVTNVQFGGDGHETVYVYRRVGDGPEGIQIGTLDLSDLPMNYDDWGINATAASYDPEEKVFRVHYAQKNTEEYGVLETRGLERFEFSEYKKLT